jgi:hypothetical protein
MGSEGEQSFAKALSRRGLRPRRVPQQRTSGGEYADLWFDRFLVEEKSRTIFGPLAGWWEKLQREAARWAKRPLLALHLPVTGPLVILSLEGGDRCGRPSEPPAEPSEPNRTV